MDRTSAKNTELWISEVRKGSESAFQELYLNYRPAVLAYLKGRFFKYDSETAEEVFQDAILAARQQIDEFRNQSKFSTWLIGIARNKALMHLRSQKSKREKEIKISDVDIENGERPDWLERGELITSDPAIVLEHRELISQIAGSTRLKMGFTETVMASEGYSLSEISETQNIPVGTVKTRIHHFRNRLPSCYKPD